ncbi:MAG: response regulator, partial [Proteobacteria bacterium]|nr:response regulator [Pseudomonadota bacterium]
IAHDFNNILGIIIGNAELAIDDVPKQNPARLSLEEIITASRRAKDVVWQLLSFSRKSERKKEPVVMSAILKESLSLLRSSIPKTIDIQLNLSDTDSQMMADDTQIHQVIINLCTNAAHAMAEQGGRLEVNLEDIEIDLNTLTQYPSLSFGNYIKLSVSDTGHGIDPDIKDRIFDPYFTTKAMGKGTGMGLAVVHGIVKNHGGEIFVKSVPFKGTVFEIIFPAISKEIIIKDKADKLIPKGNERILLVDDEESLVAIGKRMLTRFGYTVETHTNPMEALNQFMQAPDKFDLVITDMTMPEMTGDNLIKEILKIKPGLPVILCTGYSEKITEQSAIQIGAKRYLEKPLNLQELATMVRETLDETQ